MATALLPRTVEIQRPDLIDPSSMPPALELAVQPQSKEPRGLTGMDDLRTEHENIGVVVGAAVLCRIRVVTERGPNSGESIQSHRRSDTGGIDHQSELGLAALNRLTDTDRDVRVVDRIGGVTSAVEVRDSEFLLEESSELLFKRESAVVGTDGESLPGTVQTVRNPFQVSFLVERARVVGSALAHVVGRCARSKAPGKS